MRNASLVSVIPLAFLAALGASVDSPLTPLAVILIALIVVGDGLVKG